MEVAKLSALRTGRLYPPGNIAGIHFCQRLTRPQGHYGAGMITSMKNSNIILGNRTRDLPACSAIVAKLRLLRHIRWPVRLSARISAAPSGHIAVKCDPGDFSRKSVRKIQNLLKSGTLPEDLSMFHYYR